MRPQHNPPSRPLAAFLLGVLALPASSGGAAAAQQPDGLSGARMVALDGRAVRVLAQGLENRVAGKPVVVFEAGATNALEVWRHVLPRVAELAPVVAYDRAGLGSSEWDSRSPTPRHVADRLRRLLEQIGAPPPYLLVGYSWGGILARYFAGYYPESVAGAVFVDPGPMVTRSLPENLAPFDSVGAGRRGYDAFWSRFGNLFRQSPEAVRAEFEVFRGLMEMNLAERDIRPLPQVPVAVLVAGKYLPLGPAMELPYDPRAQFDFDLRHRIRILQEWTLGSPEGTLVVSNRSTHAMPREDPELIVWGVRRVLAAVASRP